MITKLTTVSVYPILQLAWALCRAGERAVFAPSDLAARFWTRVGNTGETIEAFVDCLASKLGIDVAAHMIERNRAPS